MTKYKGGDKAAGGTYWNIANGSRVDIHDEGVLPGDQKTTYVKVPVLGVLVAGPIIGLFYIFALPFIAMVKVVAIVGGNILGSIFDFLKAIASFEWAPNEAQFTGRRRRKLRGKSTRGEVKSPLKKGGNDVYLI